MICLIVNPKKNPRIADIEMDYETLKKTVGGPTLDVYYLEDTVGVIRNNDADLTGLPFNRIIRDAEGAAVACFDGTIIVVGITASGRFVGLTDDQVKRYGELFWNKDESGPGLLQNNNENLGVHKDEHGAVR